MGNLGSMGRTRSDGQRMVSNWTRSKSQPSQPGDSSWTHCKYDSESGAITQHNSKPICARTAPLEVDPQVSDCERDSKGRCGQQVPSGSVEFISTSSFDMDGS